MERVIGRDEPAYKNFEKVAEYLEILSPNGARYVVRDVYLDLSQGWVWTTICREGFRDCQVLTPKDWRKIFTAEEHELIWIVDEIRKDKFFGDK